MRPIMMLLLVAMSIAAFAAPPRVGIQQNLPVYVAGGVITQQEATAIQARINEGLLMETFVRAGEHGRNYWVTQNGQLRSKDYYVEPLDMNEDSVKGRYARTDGCHIWFGGEQSHRSCDNLFVPAYQPKPPCVKPTPPPSPPPQAPPTETIEPIPLASPSPAPALPTITPIGLAARIEPIPAGEEPVCPKPPLAFGKSALVKGEMPYVIVGQGQEIRAGLFGWSIRSKAERQKPKPIVHPPCPPAHPAPVSPNCPLPSIGQAPVPGHTGPPITPAPRVQH